MVEQEHYPNAPITEATIDLRVTQPQRISIEDLIGIQTLVAEEYPNYEGEYVFSGEMRLEEDTNQTLLTETMNRHNGFRFTSRDKRRVFYARLGGFAFSVRAPYDRWEQFRDEARHLWDLYRSATEVEGVTRVAVRYINHLDIASYAPDPSRVEFEDFLRVYPELPRDWPGGDLISNFFMQLQIW